jgi:hypothetical protein
VNEAIGPCAIAINSGEDAHASILAMCQQLGIADLPEPEDKMRQLAYTESGLRVALMLNHQWIQARAEKLIQPCFNRIATEEFGVGMRQARAMVAHD